MHEVRPLVRVITTDHHTVSQKKNTLDFFYNFGKCRPIAKIPLLSDLRKFCTYSLSRMSTSP